LFGTDGIRGIAGTHLDAITAYKVGQAAAVVLTEKTHHKPIVIIGKDTRISSDMLEAALAAGVTSAGADVVLCGVVPTPAVAYLTQKGADAGVVISASHNPFAYNGVKIFCKDGYKLPDAQEDEIETLMAGGVAPKTGAGIGRVRQDPAAAETYIGHLGACVPGDFSGLRIVADCANGAAAVTAEKLLRKYTPAKLTVIHDTPDGVNINDNCGSTHMETLRQRVLEGGYDVGLAFDGDADRLLVVDERGVMVDGDRLMAVCALYEKKAGHLPGDAFVATVMSNLGLYEWADNVGLKILRAPVGDRYVLEEMRKHGCLLGGEQSGHVIFARHSTTGDGQLTALKLLNVLADSGLPLSELHREIPKYPQVLQNVIIDEGHKAHLMEHPSVLAAVEKAQKQLGGKGRILVRPSGTEALIRVMAEGRDETEIKTLCDEIAECIKRV